RLRRSHRALHVFDATLGDNIGWRARGGIHQRPRPGGRDTLSINQQPISRQRFENHSVPPRVGMPASDSDVWLAGHPRLWAVYGPAESGSRASHLDVGRVSLAIVAN